MIALRPWLRLYRTHDGAFLESILEERAVPLDDALLATLQALAQGPVASSTEIVARSGADKGAVHGALSRLLGLKLLDMEEPSTTSSMWARIGDRMPAIPVVDNVELTNICPMSCAMCPTGSGEMTRAKGRMEPALFKKLVDDVAPHKNHGKPLTLHNLGESTLHPHLVEFVALAQKVGLATELSANPGHLPVSLFAALEEAGLSRLVLSVDGVDAETLEAIRGKGARGDAAFMNLDAIFEHRRTARRGPTQVVVQMIRQRQNAGQAAAFLERFGALGLADVSAYVKEIDANTADAGDALYEIGRPRRPYLCRAPWRSVVVLWNGDVVPCCHDDNGKVVYGNLSSSSLASIWRAGAAEALRQRLVSGETARDEPCGSCAHRADRYPLPSLAAVVPDEPLHW